MAITFAPQDLQSCGLEYKDLQSAYRIADAYTDGHRIRKSDETKNEQTNK